MSAPSVEHAPAPDDRPARRNRLTIGLMSSFVGVCLIWGSTWIAIKLAVTDMPPLMASGLRFVIAAPVFLGACWAMKVPVRYPRRLNWFAVFIFACYFAIPFALYNFGEVYISSGLAAICFSSVAVLMVIFGVPLLGNRITLVQGVAVIVAFVSLGVLISHSQGFSVENPWGVAAMLVAATLHALAYTMIKKYGTTIHSLTLNTLPMIAAGIVLVGLSLVVERPDASAFTTQSVLATLYLGIVASVIGFAVYFWLVQRMDTITASFVFVLFPIVAQVFAVVVENVAFNALDILLTLLILSAFGVTQWGQRRAARLTADAATLDAHGHPTEAALALMYRHAEEAYPVEACGFVRASGVTRCVNAIDELATTRSDEYSRTSRTGYAFGVGDLRELAESFDGPDPVRLVYHSHPNVGAYFSDEDERHASFEGMPVYPVRHLVVDATAHGARGARLFEFSEEAGRYVECATYGLPAGWDETRFATQRADGPA